MNFNCQREAAFMGTFCDLKNFAKKGGNSSCPIPKAGPDLTPEEKAKHERNKRNVDSDRILFSINSSFDETEGATGEYGFSTTVKLSILTAIDSLPDNSPIKAEAEAFVEEREGKAEDLDEHESLMVWADIFKELKAFLEEKYGKAEDLTPQEEKELAQTNHNDPIDSYKNEVPGCTRPGKCCIKCDILISCPVPESICSRVINWALETRAELAPEGKSDPGRDPSNIKHTMEPVPSKATLEKLKTTDPDKYEYFQQVIKRKEKEELEEKNPYNQKQEELELEEIYPGIMEWYRANWDWLLDLKDKQIPELDAEGKPTGRTLSFSDKEWQNINAPEIRALLQGKYPEPTMEELKQYIEKAKGKRTWHGEKAKTMTPEEIITSIAKLPGISSFAESLRDFYSSGSGSTGKKLDGGTSGAE